jgi:TolB-like protein/DNA-binding winged helix-turn-helix (wHTH) protein/Tfp pilus assembly protein PilF
VEVAVYHNQIRFGVFELRREARELLKHGVRIKLEDQPFEILTALLEKPGDIVTRGELRARLWPEGTFVDFDKGLTKAVNKIRTALDDSPTNPRFIETLSRRGYRFIAPVRLDEEPHAPATAAGEPAPVAPGTVPRPHPWRRRTLWVAAGLMLLLALAGSLNLGRVRDRLLHARDLPRLQSLAVLPLENLSRDPEQEYFADGLTDALITDLGAISSLRVISRTSVMQYKRTKKALPEIARELNVDAAVEGTVLRSGNRVRITAQLLRARTDTHLWAQTYERDAEDVIRLERQMALAIASQVSGQLTLADRTIAPGSRTPNPAAFDAYLRGRYFWNMRDAKAIPEAVGYFEQALRQDPNFALAWSGLADCYSTGWWTAVDYSRAETYARKALALAPELAEAHISLGYAEYDLGRFANAEREARRGIELDPNYVTAHHFLAFCLLTEGRMTEALAENDRARQLDPFSVPVAFSRGVIFMSLHEYARAAEQFAAAAEFNPQAPAPHEGLAHLYWIEGRIPEAVSEERKKAVLASSPEQLRNQDEVAAVYARSGAAAAARRSAQLKARTYRGDNVDAFLIAAQYGIAGDKEKALEWLNRAVRMKGSSNWFKLRYPVFDFMRSDPRYQDLVRRIGLAP